MNPLAPIKVEKFEICVIKQTKGDFSILPFYKITSKSQLWQRCKHGESDRPRSFNSRAHSYPPRVRVRMINEGEKWQRQANIIAAAKMKRRKDGRAARARSC